jgi:methanogenic corrinoid protein MtbC1
VFAAAGWRVLMLGTNTPIDQIAALTREARLAAVAVSCALPRRRRVIEHLRALRRRLPRTVVVVAGGAGAPRTPPAPGIEIMNDFPALERWLNDRAA